MQFMHNPPSTSKHEYLKGLHVFEKRDAKLYHNPTTLGYRGRLVMSGCKAARILTTRGGPSCAHVSCAVRLLNEGIGLWYTVVNCDGVFAANSIVPCHSVTTTDKGPRHLNYHSYSAERPLQDTHELLPPQTFL